MIIFYTKISISAKFYPCTKNSFTRIKKGPSPGMGQVFAKEYQFSFGKIIYVIGIAKCDKA